MSGIDGKFFITDKELFEYIRDLETALGISPLKSPISFGVVCSSSQETRYQDDLRPIEERIRHEKERLESEIQKRQKRVQVADRNSEESDN